ncbi:MAG: hypothetical protein AAF399_28550 [Bacteroidota bacterium]
MNSWDLLSKRILAFGLACSALLLSGSLFVFSIQRLVAEPKVPVVQQINSTDNTVVTATDDAVYVVEVYDGLPAVIHRVDASGWTRLDKY